MSDIPPGCKRLCYDLAYKPGDSPTACLNSCPTLAACRKVMGMVLNEEYMPDPSPLHAVHPLPCEDLCVTNNIFTEITCRDKCGQTWCQKYGDLPLPTERLSTSTILLIVVGGVIVLVLIIVAIKKKVWRWQCVLRSAERFTVTFQSNKSDNCESQKSADVGREPDETRAPLLNGDLREVQPDREDIEANANNERIARIMKKTADDQSGLGGVEDGHSQGGLSVISIVDEVNDNGSVAEEADASDTGQQEVHDVAFANEPRREGIEGQEEITENLNEEEIDREENEGIQAPAGRGTVGENIEEGRVGEGVENEGSEDRRLENGIAVEDHDGWSLPEREPTGQEGVGTESRLTEEGVNRLSDEPSVLGDGTWLGGEEGETALNTTEVDLDGTEGRDEGNQEVNDEEEELGAAIVEIDEERDRSPGNEGGIPQLGEDNEESDEDEIASGYGEDGAGNERLDTEDIELNENEFVRGLEEERRDRAENERLDMEDIELNENEFVRGLEEDRRPTAVVRPVPVQDIEPRRPEPVVNIDQGAFVPSGIGYHNYTP